MVKFIENSGESFENAIVIQGVGHNFEGLGAENRYLEEKYGPRGKDWVPEQVLVAKDGKFYDIVELNFLNGKSKTLYFDISDFYRKWQER